MKLSFEDKKEIIRLRKSEFRTMKEICLKFNIAKTTFTKIIKIYEKYGIDALKHPTKKKKYSAEFKYKIIRLVYEGKSKKSLVIEYNLPSTATILSWIHKYEEFGYNGLISKNGRLKKMDIKKEEKENNIDVSSPLVDSERLEFEELKRQNKTLQETNLQLQMENDVLKKLDALIQKKGQKKEEKK